MLFGDPDHVNVDPDHVNVDPDHVNVDQDPAFLFMNYFVLQMNFLVSILLKNFVTTLLELPFFPSSCTRMSLIKLCNFT